MPLPNLTEEQIQALIVLGELQDPVETPNNTHYRFYPKSEDQALAYFRTNALPLAEASYATLEKLGLARREMTRWVLTDAGLDLARAFRKARPPIYYWYQDFYAAVAHSPAFADYCIRAFGRDLSQQGFSDMTEVELMIELAALRPGQRLLDIGCGNGKMAEYISDVTGAHALGVDYIPAAIDQARQRTAAKRARLDFVYGDLRELELPTRAFDVILSVDSIFFGDSLEQTLTQLKALLVPGGSMVIATGDDLTSAFEQAGLAYEAHDVSANHAAHMKRKHQVAASLEAAFRQEGHAFLWENVMTESLDGDSAKGRAVTRLPRTIYRARAC